MQRILLAALVLLLLPASTFAARAPSSFSAGRSLIVASSSPGNTYVAGASVVVTAPVSGDLSAAGGSVLATAPVSGDALLLGGSVSSRSRVAGDLRAFGGGVTIEEAVAGDLVALGYSVRDVAPAHGSVFIAAVNVAVESGSGGPITVYGNDVSLAGTFEGDVTVVASGRLSLSASTTIRGKLSYQAPEPVLIPLSVSIAGGIEYTDASFLPSAGTSRALGFVSMGFFLLVRILGMLILAGLLAGLFPKLAGEVALHADAGRPREILLSMLLGFAVLVATPVLLLLLFLTFVGIGLALLLTVLYALVALLAVTYSGILLGGLFARRFFGRDALFWHDGVLGMFALSLVALVPVVGLFVVFLLAVFSAGTLLQIFFHFAFPHEEHTSEML